MGGILAHRAGVPDGVLFLALIMLGYLQYLTIRRAWKLARWIRRRRLPGRTVARMWINNNSSAFLVPIQTLER
jgi:hypothetical protein